MSRKDWNFKRFFRPKLGDLQKKKKKKEKVFAKIQSDFSAEIQNSNVFSAQNQVISEKKKKGLRQYSGRFFSQFRKFKRMRGGSFRMGGAIFHFSQKIGLKSTKNMRFCILHKPMGGARAPPPPPLATLLIVIMNEQNCRKQSSLKFDVKINSGPFFHVV